MRNKRLGGPFVVVAAMVLLSACGSSGTSSDSDTGSAAASEAPASEAPASSAPAEETAPASTDAKPNEGAVIYNLQNYIHPFIEGVNKGVNSEAAELGLTVEYSNANGDLTAQIAQIDNAIAAGAKGIVIQPIDSMAVIPAIDRATAAGLCVASVAVPIGPTTGAVHPGTKAFVGWDETVSGATVAQGLAAEIGESGGVAFLAGDLTNGATAARIEGLTAEFANYPGIQILDTQQHKFDTDQARSLALGMLTKYGSDLKALFVDTNPAAVAVANALKGKGVAIGSIGGMQAYIDLIASGDATVDVPEAPAGEGAMAVKLINDCISGDREPVFFPETDLPALAGLAGTNYMITKDSLGGFTPDW